MSDLEDNERHARCAAHIVRSVGSGSIQISPHYLDPDPTSTHMGETQEERIMQFLEENEEAAVGLREGSILRVEGSEVILKAPNSARIFRRGEEPVEAVSCSNLGPLLERTPAHVGRAA